MINAKPVGRSIIKALKPPAENYRAQGGAFTLIELLIVLLLMGIVYAIAFNNVIPKTSKKATASLSLRTIDGYFKSLSAYRTMDLVLYGTENGTCYLTGNGKILETLNLPRVGEGYRLNPDETLQSIDYPHLKIGTTEFAPVFSIRCRKDGMLDPQIIRVNEKWLYIHPFEPPKLFDNAVEMVSYIRQSDYLPDRAGYAQ
ncbi:prepilin-type N-terminal cleavage/methylation domain-containing protein [Hydrogenimonas urashimensis]|uniref:prepilin-type N-terminal cleavage/methylation domain-containing protein n=1 Tax=Hydrogenimonas urashimensis TaxID=2740515 RepID=UPI0019164C00|nr:prepilin-type N-terminal cleavage/methylation domain-containing protein [Hydrogenimonas urashimensis]